MTDSKAEATDRARRAMEVWASTYDAFFQDFMEKGLANDALGSAIAAARIAQLSSYCMAEFHAMAELLVDGNTAIRACNEAAMAVIAMVDKQLKAIYPDRFSGDSAAPDTAPCPDRTLS